MSIWWIGELILTLGSRVVGTVHDGSNGKTEGHSELGSGSSGWTLVMNGFGGMG